MTEQEWLECTDPQGMLEFLQGKASDRKVGLFSQACCESALALTDDPLCWNLIEIAERFADDQATVSELQEARQCVYQHYRGPWHDSGPRSWEQVDDILFKSAVGAAVFCAAGGSVERPLDGDAMTAIQHCQEALRWLAISVAQEEGMSFEDEHQAERLRCIFGPLPFRPITVHPSWPTRNFKQIAEAIYQDRAFDRLPILADALEDAGCDNAEMLSHCRSGGEHALGCWVLDAVRGKN
jgi:hypothetical protein